MPASLETLVAKNDLAWASSGSLGYLLLLTGDVYSASWTVNTSTDLITTASDHGLVTGSRVRVSTTTSLPAISPGTLNSSTDYFVIYDDTNTLKLATTLGNANSNIALNFTDTGSGTHTITEQLVVADDPITVLVNKELPSALGYSRKHITGVSGAAIAGSYAEKAPVVLSYTASGGDLVWRHALFLEGATSTIGNTTGTGVFLTTESGDQTITSGSTKNYNVTLRTRNP
jgi:hypothetical protein